MSASACSRNCRTRPPGHRHRPPSRPHRGAAGHDPGAGRCGWPCGAGPHPCRSRCSHQFGPVLGAWSRRADRRGPGRGGARYLVVRGAGSLEVAPGKRLLDQPDFPEAYRPEARGGAAFLDALRGRMTLTGRSCRPRPSLRRASAPAPSGWAPMRCCRARAARISRSRISPSPWWTSLPPRHRRARFTVGYQARSGGATGGGGAASV